MQIKAYEPHIDGLRAVAVAAVLLFHAGVPGFAGGFVGVDVFFVISGYLITGIISREISDGSFSILQFYERRARRILPALLTVLTATLVVGAVVLVPHQLTGLAQSTFATLSFASNIWFWRTIDYFSGDQHLLLHTWSLGVEEQFYIFFPLALGFFARVNRVGVGLAALFCASLALSVYLTPRMPAASFYLLPTRGWELLIGAMLARGRLTAPPWIGWVGLGAILAATSLFDASTRFPGWVALLPTLGAASFIAARHSSAARLLSLRPVVGLGLVSYSLYLWHWPALLFSRQAGLDGPAWGMVALLASLVLAVLSWRFIEGPFRARSAMPTGRLLKITAAGLMSVSLLAAVSLSGLLSRYSSEALQFAAGSADKPWSSIRCEQSPCIVGLGAPRYALWGDSHAGALGEAVSLGADGPGRIVAFNACPPVLAFRPINLKGRDLNECFERNAGLATERAPVIILAAYWPSYLEQPGFSEKFKATLKLLVRSGKKVVVIVGPGSADRDLPSNLMQQLRWTGGFDKHFARNVPPATFLDLISTSGAKVIDIGQILCPDDLCPTTINGHPLYFDSHHLSGNTGRYLGPLLAAPLASASR
ncbi:acyltransferase family protein [Sphingomonas glaciei]|uniref:Acyltransferase n=1 Tax=Sphingomonas glaciei TaxID=2938948 RepID=A0ABY5MVI9_9SPHN|nr:acyltransferase family protein [Sphingomonas glaciei]UUR08137.1 acyltransferase [Sphingomonas glaciei]